MYVRIQWMDAGIPTPMVSTYFIIISHNCSEFECTHKNSAGYRLLIRHYAAWPSHTACQCSIDQWSKDFHLKDILSFGGHKYIIFGQHWLQSQIAGILYLQSTPHFSFCDYCDRYGRILRGVTELKKAFHCSSWSALFFSPATAKDSSTLTVSYAVFLVL